MSIPILLEKIKSFIGSEKGKDIFVVIVVVCVAISSFLLGRLSIAQNSTSSPVVVKFDPSVTDYFFKDEKAGEASTPTLSSEVKSSSSAGSKVSMVSEIKTDPNESSEAESTQTGNDNEKGEIVASSRGSKYYYVYCSGAKTLSETNKVYFSSEEEAEANGYTLSSSCTKK